MSVKAMSLVWDFPCPANVNGIDFKPNHKYVLVAYADHADHNGRNIYPAVETIAKKTGYDARSVQRLARDLEDMKILIPDGMGPRGTNRYYIPFSDGGDKLSPLTSCQGDKIGKSLGDIPSGDIPSGDKMSPELKNINPQNLYINQSIKDNWVEIKNRMQAEMPKAQFETWLKDTEVNGIQDQFMVVTCRNSYAVQWLESHIQTLINTTSGYYVKFVSISEFGELQTQ